jgi:glycosyltransferase involved in cell wall biosynthesis
MQAVTPAGPISLIAVMEATTVTGPAKNLIEFFRTARRPDRERPDLPYIRPRVATFVRGPVGTSNAFVSAVAAAELEVDVLAERFRFDPGCLADLRARIVRLKPDLVQTHNVKSHFLFRLSGLHRSVRWIAFHHGYTTTDLKMRAYNLLDRWSLRGAHRVITVCRAFAQDLERHGVQASRLRVLHNSVRLPARPAPEVVAGLRERLRIPHGSPTVLAVGRLSREKGHAFLIEALATLRRQYPRDVRLVLVGDGPERGNLEAAVRAAGLGEVVQFAGHTTDVQPFYAMCDALALPSLSEGSPNVVLEAMAAGLPIAATAVGGVPEIVENEVSGLLVKPANAAALADALVRLLTDGALARRLSASAMERVTRSFTPEAFRRSLLEIYGEALR